MANDAIGLMVRGLADLIVEGEILQHCENVKDYCRICDETVSLALERNPGIELWHCSVCGYVIDIDVDDFDEVME